jgi:hypothetical protein
MAWREDEALNRFFEATLVLRELYGPERVVDLYEQELQRELVLRNHTANNKAIAAATSALQQSSAQLNIAVKALEFYAEGDNHKVRNGQPSPIGKDKGRHARRALEAISGDGEAEDAEGEVGEL